MDLPREFRQRMETLLGHQASDFFESMEKEPRRALRLDPLLFTEEEFALFEKEASLRSVPFAENAYFFDFDGIGNTALHHSGALYVQEGAAMAPVAALEKKQVSSILDLCASPGGKSLQAAASLLSKDGLLICNEPSGIRRKVLMQNLERLGESRCAVTGFDGTWLPPVFSGRFDLVICDVPCSGEGMMRKNQEAASLWSQKHVEELSLLQSKILDSAAKAVAPGGRILYSTCTWSEEENEKNVLSFLARHSDFSLIPPNDEVCLCGKEGLVPHTLRFYPHLFEGEGQFLAVFQHSGSEKEILSPKKKKKEAKKDPREEVVRAFLEENLETIPDGEILFRGDDAYLSLCAPFPQDLFVSPGICLGYIQKNRLVPHHRLFRALAKQFKNRFVIPFDDERVEAYLRGEEIPLSGKGYGCLFAGEKPLGGVKVSDGRGKNLYPKGLRKT